MILRNIKCLTLYHAQANLFGFWRLNLYIVEDQSLHKQGIGSTVKIRHVPCGSYQNIVIKWANPRVKRNLLKINGKDSHLSTLLNNKNTLAFPVMHKVNNK